MSEDKQAKIKKLLEMQKQRPKKAAKAVVG